MIDRSAVVFEVHLGDQWERMGALAEMEPCGSVSSHDPGGRQMILFGWFEGVPGVWRSVAGVDVANDAIREVRALALEQLADLTTGPYERPIVTAAGEMRARWRLDIGHQDHDPLDDTTPMSAYVTEEEVEAHRPRARDDDHG